MEPAADAPPAPPAPPPAAAGQVAPPALEGHTEPDGGYEAVLAAAEQVLDGVDRALARLQDGTYGTCQACGAPIPDHALEADPTAGHCGAH